MSGRKSIRAEDGYTLVGLLIVVAVVNISLAVAVTSWRTLDQRAREAELIWRGEQIAQAIACHAATAAGEPLENLEQLVESNCLRRLYRDPMSTDGEWRVLRRSDIADGTIAALRGESIADPSNAGEEVGGDGLQLGAGVALQRPQLQRIGTGVGGGDAVIGVMTTRTGPALRV
ncbi:MAG: hypothetical protein GKS06_04320 [Acidobacteria bacterium]|nr:hypothetical protein [Acidobacteriota bacterium]